MIEQNVKVLHISNSYGGTAVYKNMFQNLDEISVQQTVFVPLNKNNRYRTGSHNIDFKVAGSEIIYDTSLRYWHKFFYDKKIATVFNAIEDKIGNNIKNYNLIHASTLCADGGVAYELWKKYNIPYVVSVRGTDMSFYYEKMFFKRNYFHKILLNSSFVVFISPSLKEKFFERIPVKICEALKNKIKIIPNGVDKVFLDHISPPTALNNPIKIVYYGGIQKNKNLHSTIKAIELLREKNLNLQYTIIGKGLLHRRTTPQYVKKIEDLCKRNPWITILESMQKEELQKEISKHDIFVMPSFKETFGLAYVEALSQGVPIIYSKGQGFDGYFPDGNLGYSVDTNNVNDITSKIELIIKNYSSLCNNLEQLSFEQFDWKNIAEEYKHLYFLSIKN